jgi:ribonuclease Y
VIVDPKDITDRGSAKLARDIALQIEQTMTYPGEVKVVVMRETRTVGIAR